MRGMTLSVMFLAASLLLSSTASAYLQPATGRFLQRDPVGYVDGMSAYEYTRSAPTVYVDTTGAQAVPLIRPIPTPMFPRMGPLLPPEPFYPPMPVPPWGFGHPRTELPSDLNYYEDWNRPLLPERETEYWGYQPPPSPTYDPRTNPDRDCEKPCGRYVNAYKTSEKSLKEYRDAIPRGVDEWNCEQLQRMYALRQKMWHERIIASACHQRHGLDDGRHGKAVADLKQGMDRVYKVMRKVCNETRSRILHVLPPGPIT